MTPITVMALESSCDESAVSIIRQGSDQFEILAEKLYSQIDDHQKHGGVVPEIAARQHLAHFPKLIRDALDMSDLKVNELDAIACTTGPGLIGGLLVGSMFARSMALQHNIPFYGIHHLEGHLLSPRLPNLQTKKPSFPYLVILASGGHTLIALALNIGSYHIIGQSRDDALGEAFDKSSIVMGLPYPGGPELEKRAHHGDEKKFQLPTPLVGAREKSDRESADFSFSGLKTAVARLWASLTFEDQQDQEQAQKDIAASFHLAVQKILENRLKNALNITKNNFQCTISDVVFVGGVAANRILCDHLDQYCTNQGISLSTVPAHLCTDNATMIAWAGLERISLGIDPIEEHKITRPRWSLEQI